MRRRRGVMPAALPFNSVNPIMVQGAAVAGTTLMPGFEMDITRSVPNGAPVELDPIGTPPTCAS